MKVCLVLAALVLSGCASTTGPAPVSRGKPQPRAGGAPPIPSSPTTVASRETVVPTDVVAVGFCEAPKSGWMVKHWYAVEINGSQQAWAGPLIPATGPIGCDTGNTAWQTPKAYSFPNPGQYTLGLRLVNHCDPGDTDPLCQQCAAANGGLTCNTDAYSTPPTTIDVTSGPAGCTYGVTPLEAQIPDTGGPGAAKITVAEGCAWTSTANDPWLTIATGATGSGPGTVSYTAAATTAGPRQGTLTVAGQTVTVKQLSAPCAYTLTPKTNAIQASGGTNSIAVDVTAGAPCPWVASSPVAWVTFPDVRTAGTGGVAQYTVLPNTDQAERSVTLTVAGLPFQLVQSGTTTDVCRPGAAEAAGVSVVGVRPSRVNTLQPMGPIYTLSSKTPITTLIVRMNSVIVGQLGVGTTDLTHTAGMWFNAPPKGTYALTVEVVNGYGCHRTSSENVTVTVR